MMAEPDDSPLTARPLNVPGQSVDESLREFADKHFILPLFLCLTLFSITVWEWFAYLKRLPPKPWLFTILSILAFVGGAIYWRLKWPEAMRLRLGRNGERAVGQYLDRYSEPDATVFHDIPGPKGNIDHVVICSRGVYAIETKTRTKPKGSKAIVTVENDGLKVNHRAPDRDPMVQARACSNELKKILKDSTGKPFEVQPVVLFPGWYIEDKRQSRNEVWVLEPKALPAWIRNRKPTIEPSDVSLATYHLSRHIRTHPQS
jgi:hypothetical protein